MKLQDLDKALALRQTLKKIANDTEWFEDMENSGTVDVLGIVISDPEDTKTIREIVINDLNRRKAKAEKELNDIL